MNPKTFIFESYKFTPEKRELNLVYSLDGKIRFEEHLILPKGEFQKLDPELLDRLLFNLHLIGGISYYKTYCPPNIQVKSGHLSKAEALFWNKLYTQGLGEFFYKNDVDFRALVNFPVTSDFNGKTISLNLPRRSLVPLGGGKDSIVACELMKKAGLDFDVFNLGNHKVAVKVAEVMEKKLMVVKRSLSDKLFELNKEGAMNGHIPITAYVAFLSVLMGALYGYDSVVFANEASANHGNVIMYGMEVNHQYSKSLEFERDLRTYLHKFVTPDLQVFSILRPWYELRIAKEYAAMSKYHYVASSCNRNFKIHGDSLKYLWCGECPKCAFVFLVLAPFMKKEHLLKIFGKDMLDDKNLLPLYEELAGLKNIKPFECVGTPDEIIKALELLKQKEENKNDFIVRHIKANSKRSDLMMQHPSHLIPSPFLRCFKWSFLILGYGKEGRHTYKYLSNKYPNASFGIADQNKVSTPKNTKPHFGKSYLTALSYYDIIIKSPGISWKKEFKDHKEKFTSGTQIFFDQLDPSNTVIAISGSKGKSSTAALMAHVLRRCGKNVICVGNIGEPMLKHTDVKNHYVVVELSSYQLENLIFSPHIAILTCIFPDHLDYHGGFEAYINAKAKITACQSPNDFLIYHSKYIEIENMPSKALRIKITEYENTETLLRGQHNQDNIALIKAASHIMQLDKSSVLRAISDFQALPHRLQIVDRHRGVTYVDDANATTPEATIAALKSFDGKVGTIFLGGQDRGYDFNELGLALAKQNVENIVLFPDSGKVIEKAWPINYRPNVFETKSMKEAVLWASKHTQSGYIVLLSMASPSYSLFKNFQDKGLQFQKYLKLIKEQS